MSKRRFILISALVSLVVLVSAASVSAAPWNKHNRFGPPSGASKTVAGPAATATPTAADMAADMAATAALPGRVIVEFKPGTSVRVGRAVAGRSDATVLRTISRSWVKDGSRLVVVRSATLSTAELVKQLTADPTVEYAEPDYILHADVTPNDPLWSSLWGMTQIGAPDAWNVTTGSAEVVIADIDTGVDYTHPDLATNMWTNPGEIPGNGIDDDGNDYVDDVYGIDRANSDSDPRDDQGHGSHTSGTAAGVGNNGTGVAGVCWTARIMALKYLGSDGSGYTSDAVTCIDYVYWEKTHGINVAVINASWGGGGYSSSLESAITAAGNAGIVFVASAGNDTNDNDASPSYPASYNCSNIISVAASNSTDALADFSNYGATSVDLAAPGEDILSTVPSVYDSSGYAWMDGTSMAAPHVTGAVALCAAQFPSETMAQRISRILNSTDAVGALSGYCVTGGRLNVAKAIGGSPGGDTTPPVTTASGADDLWHNHDVKIALTATDEQGGSGVASIFGGFDGGAATEVPGASAVATIVALRDHSNDGLTTLAYYAKDNAGNLGVAQTVTVKIDTRGPTCSAKNATVRRGRKGKLWFNVKDTLSPQVKETIRIKTRRGATKATFKWKTWDNVLPRGRMWYINPRWTLAKGTYYVYVTGKDLAGNNASRIGKAKLVVK